MLFDSQAARDIYLVFMNAPYKLNWIFKDRFQHVYIIERTVLGWLCTDPSRSDLHTYILPAHYEAEVVQEYIRQNPNSPILHLNVKPHSNVLYPVLGITSCVTIIQYILGVSWFFVLTPYQLYNKIINNPPEHIEVLEWLDIQNTQRNEKQKKQL